LIDNAKEGMRFIDLIVGDPSGGPQYLKEVPGSPGWMLEKEAAAVLLNELHKRHKILVLLAGLILRQGSGCRL